MALKLMTTYLVRHRLIGDAVGLHQDLALTAIVWIAGEACYFLWRQKATKNLPANWQACLTSVRMAGRLFSKGSLVGVEIGVKILNSIT